MTKAIAEKTGIFIDIDEKAGHATVIMAGTFKILTFAMVCALKNHDLEKIVRLALRYHVEHPAPDDDDEIDNDFGLQS